MITEEEVQQAQSNFQKIEESMAEVVVGQKNVINSALICLLCRGNLLLEGVPGLGKTLIVRTLASTLGLEFSRIQFTPDLMPADIVGTNIITEKRGERRFSFSEGPIFANVVLADEINRATPKTQAALLEAMEEKTVTVGNETYSLEEPFIVLATQNPIEMEGTYPLPEAQVDRFTFKEDVRYPDLEELVEIAERNTENHGLTLPESRVTGEEILQARRVVEEIPLAVELRRYVARLVMATHPSSEFAPSAVDSYVEYGASPRAALSLIRGAKAHAFLAGEYNVSLEDIEATFLPAFRHRLIFNFRGESEGIEVEKLLGEVWESVEVV